MTEAVVANTATVIRILLVGGFLVILPLITRKGLLFGAYVGEELAAGDAARRLVRRWNLACALLMVLSLCVGLGISLAGRPLAGNFTATAFLLLTGLGLYLRTYYAARRLAPPAVDEQAGMAVAVLEEGEPRGVGLAKLALAICLLASLATLVYATVAGTSGDAEGWSGKAAVTALFVPSLNLVVSPFFALLALLTARAKRSIRGGTGGRSAEAQVQFRATMANLISGTAIFICVLLTFLSIHIVRSGLSEFGPWGVAFLVTAVAMIVFTFGNLIRVVVKYGQGGALIEEASVEAPLTNGLADNAHWVWGAFYVNRNDPSIMVEKRFGIGYTMNYGNWKAALIVGTFLVLLAGLTAVGLIGMS